MSLQEEIVLREKEIKVLKEMQDTNYRDIAKDTLFAVSDSLEAVAQGMGRLRYFSHLDDGKCIFFLDGCTSHTNEGVCAQSKYWERVHTPSETVFRDWVSMNIDTKGKLHFHKSNWPNNLPTNYLEILKEEL